MELETRQEEKTTQHLSRTQAEGISGERRQRLLTEAEEQRIHTHGVHAEEAVGDEVGSHDHRLQKEHTHTKVCYVIPESILSDYQDQKKKKTMWIKTIARV